MFAGRCGVIKYQGENGVRLQQHVNADEITVSLTGQTVRVIKPPPTATAATTPPTEQPRRGAQAPNGRLRRTRVRQPGVSDFRSLWVGLTGRNRP